MAINANCDTLIMQATKLQKLIRRKNQMGFARKQDFRADMFNNNSSN